MMHVYVNHKPVKLCAVNSCTINMQKEKTPLGGVSTALTKSLFTQCWDLYQKMLKALLKSTLVLRSGKFLKVILKRLHKVSSKFHPNEKRQHFY